MMMDRKIGLFVLLFFQMSCSAPREKSQVCNDNCQSLGASRCDQSSNGILVCGPSVNGCKEEVLLNCKADEQCSNGACVVPCTDLCTSESAVRCDDTGTQQLRCEKNTSGCLSETKIPCPGKQTCIAGKCVAVCQDDCEREGQSQCDSAGNGRWVCLLSDQGCLQKVFEACPENHKCFVENCAPCSGPAGTFSGKSFQAGNEERIYYLYVPNSYDCSNPWPVLFDLHGTAGEAETPEQAYGLEAARVAADQEGFILVRPRSRCSIEGGASICRWDQNPGDPERNREYIRSLLSTLGENYHLDPDRFYIMGFSSGTNQTVWALRDPDSPFSGYGFVGGGAFDVESLPATHARFYLNTGFRDYMRVYHYQLLQLLERAGVTPDQVFSRETDNGHDLYGWMYPELWKFLDADVRPDVGKLLPGWTAENSTTDGSLIALESLPGGSMLAAGQDGVFLSRSPDGSDWRSLAISGQPNTPGRFDWTSICVGEEGTGFVVGGGLLARTMDGGRTWSHRPGTPDYSGFGMGFGHLNSVACNLGKTIGIGYWTGASSQDGEDSWAQVEFNVSYGIYQYHAQGAAIRSSPWGTWMAVGYWDYASRSEDGVHFTMVNPDQPADWILDAAPVSQNIWILVGDSGSIWRSVDDGASFQRVASGTDADLYAVAFQDQNLGLAVGLFGTALLTKDGGLSWINCSSGLNGYLGDLQWQGDKTAVVVGESGAALHFDSEACQEPTPKARKGQRPGSSASSPSGITPGMWLKNGR